MRRRISQHEIRRVRACTRACNRFSSSTCCQFEKKFRNNTQANAPIHHYGPLFHVFYEIPFFESFIVLINRKWTMTYNKRKIFDIYNHNYMLL